MDLMQAPLTAMHPWLACARVLWVASRTLHARTCVPPHAALGKQCRCQWHVSATRSRHLLHAHGCLKCCARWFCVLLSALVHAHLRHGSQLRVTELIQTCSPAWASDLQMWSLACTRVAGGRTVCLWHSIVLFELRQPLAACRCQRAVRCSPMSDARYS